MTDEAPATSRRGVLRGAAVVGVGAALVGPLAACASSPTAASQAGSPTGAGGDKPSGTITSASDVPLRGGTVVTASGTRVVVTQPTADTYKAFTAICTHQGCTVNSVVDDVIGCPCHGSEFDAATGAVLKGPAVAPLASIPIAVQGGTISFA